jgi:acyl carrier protein
MAKENPSEETLCQWIIGAVARMARVDVSVLQPTTAFEDLGLSSLAGVTLAAELSEHFGIEVDALVTWDYPTIGEVARALSTGALDRRSLASSSR